jgi:pimeloyl-ACP methyl ester carboxylesterase
VIAPELVRFGDLTLAVRQCGSGPTIVFLHGNSCSSRAWEKQLSSPLAKRFRLVAIDLPGHGDSPPATTPERTYSLPGFAEVVGRVASQLGAESGVFVGWSLGGHILLEATNRLPKATGFLVIGVPPVSCLADYGRAATNDPALGAGFRADSTDAEVDAVVALFVRPGFPPPAIFAEDFKRTDGRVRTALTASLAAGEVRDEVRVVAELAQPLAIVHGVEERLANNRAWYDALSMPTLWRGAVQEVAGAGHAPHWETPEAFNRLLEGFALDCLGRA